MCFSKLLLGMVHLLLSGPFILHFFKYLAKIALTSCHHFLYNSTSDVTVAQLDRATVF